MAGLAANEPERRSEFGLPPVIQSWFAEKGWAPRRHQLELLACARAGRNVLLVAPSGAGKTLAGFLPSIVELAERPTEGLHTLYISPLKALAVDVQRNLLDPIGEMGLPIRVEPRTGDTPAARKARQRVRPPQMLLPAPASLRLLLSHGGGATSSTVRPARAPASISSWWRRGAQPFSANQDWMTGGSPKSLRRSGAFAASPATR